MAKAFTLEPVDTAPRPYAPAEPESIFLSTSQLEELAMRDPVKAQTIMDIQDRLAARRKKEEAAAQDAHAQLVMLQSHQKSMAEEKAGQALCERNSHRRNDGVSAIGGLRLTNGSYFLICCKCSKNFYGIGDKDDQLPRVIANTIDFSMLGAA